MVVVIHPTDFATAPLSGAAAVLVLPTGEIRSTATDLHGELREGSVAEGEVTFLLPEARPGDR